MERKNNQFTFLDNATINLGGKRTAEFFDKCDKFIPWAELAEPLKDMYAYAVFAGLLQVFSLACDGS